MSWKDYQKSFYRKQRVFFKKRNKRAGLKKTPFKFQFLLIISMFLIAIIGIPCYNNNYTTTAFSYGNSIQAFIRQTNNSLDTLKETSKGNQIVLNLDKGKKAISTLHPYLQDTAANIFQEYAIPVGAIVAINPQTGAVLAMSSHTDNYNNNDSTLPITAKYPAASIFKLITISAALEHNVIAPNDVLRATGRLKIGDKYIRDSSNVTMGSITVADALAQSCNTAFGNMALSLGVSPIEKYAKRFGFNSKIFFDMPVDISPSVIFNEPFDIAASGAGFSSTTMSPLHGAMIAAAIANKGRMMNPYLFEKIVDTQGNVIMKHKSTVAKIPITSSTAEIIKEMMIETVEGNGNAHKAFYDGKNRPYFSKIKIAAKTGSLSCDNSTKNCTWFVGFAPADNPKIALAVMVVNNSVWRAKACTVARRFLQAYFDDNTYKTMVQN